MEYFVPQEVGELLDDAHFEEAQPGLEAGDLGVEFVSGQIGGVHCGLEEGGCKGGITDQGP